MEGTIINVTRFCTDDGPGIRTTVFLKGCPLRCVWCHNPESQCPEAERYLTGETVGKRVDTREILEEAERDIPFYACSGGGVTVSGGEPLLQPEFTGEILRLCKEKGIHTAVETSGFGSVGAVETALAHCDLVLFDIKETEEGNHLAYTGVPLGPILENLRHIERMQIPVVLRLPIIPGLNDRKEHFQKVKDLASRLSCCKGVQIMPYHKLGEYKYRQLGREYPYSCLQEPEKETVEAWKGFLK